MAAIADLGQLLRQLSPALAPGEYVFCPLDPARAASLQPLATFAEAEGLSAVLAVERAAAAGLVTEPRWRCVTLRVHSSLQAVGLTAAVSGALATAGISANVIAAYHHDHVFVPSARAEAALAVLADLSRRAG